MTLLYSWHINIKWFNSRLHQAVTLPDEDSEDHGAAVENLFVF